MKRYGYKFEKFDGEMSRSIDIRFLTVVLAFFFSIGSMIYGEDHYYGLYVATSFLYILVSFSSELVSKVRNYPVVLLSVGMVYLFVNGYDDIFYHTRSVARFEWAKYKDETGYYMYLSFNCTLCFSALLGMYLPNKANNKIKPTR